MNVLILGANGFIGKHLTRKLLADEKVSLTAFSRNFDDDVRLLVKDGLRIVKGDFNNPLELVPALRNQDVVYHLITKSVASSSWNNPLAEIESNLIPTVKLLQLCVDMSIKKVVFTSSGGTVYGKREEVCTERDVLQPFSPYGIVKASVEYFLEYFKVKSDLAYDVYRISNPYGPGLDKPGFGVINTWLNAAINGHPINVYGDGSVSKDYIFIEDLVNFLDLSLLDIGRSEVFNISSGEISSLAEILKLIQSIVSHPVKVNYLSGGVGDNTIVRISNEKILQKRKGYLFYSLSEGVRKTYRKMLVDS